MTMEEVKEMSCVEGTVDGDDDRNGQEFGETITTDEVETPKAGMIFCSEEDVRNYYKNYAQHHGFATAKISTKNGDDGRQKYFSLACARNGKTVSTAKESFSPRPSSKTNCKAKINVAIRDDGSLVTTRVYLDHNHELSPGKVRHSKSKSLDSRSRRRSKVTDGTCITLSKNVHSSAVEFRDRGNLPSVKEGRNNIANTRHLQLGAGDAEALGSYFYRMQNRNSNFFYMFDFDEDRRMRNVFWSDARCRAAYESFGDVISFDTTYLANGYDMPLASFVGVNHHGQSILFGCGLLSTSDTKTFDWLFHCWLTCMSGHSPEAIVTDQCEAIQAAVADVFPESRYRLCLWQIMKKVPVKLGGLAKFRTVEKILKKIVYEAAKQEEFEKSWGKMIEDHNLEGHEWLKSLYKDRHLWVPVYVRNTFWAGISNTQSCQHMNSFFDDYVHSKTTVKQFVEQYDIVLKSKVEKEQCSDFASLNTFIPTATSLHIEKQFQNVYTHDIFKQFQEELKGLIYCNAALVKREGFQYEVTESMLGKDGVCWKEVSFDVCHNEFDSEFQCSCHLFEFKGILCRHVLSVLIKKMINEVPSRCIIERWRKDIKRGYTFVDTVYDDFGNSEQRMRRSKFSSLLFEVQQLGEESDDKCELLMRLLGETKEKLLAMDQIHGSSQNDQELSMLSTECDSVVSAKKLKRDKVDQTLLAKEKVDKSISHAE